MTVTRRLELAELQLSMITREFAGDMDLLLFRVGEAEKQIEKAKQMLA